MPRNDPLKIAIILSPFKTQRAFVESLRNSSNPLEITENRLSKILAGQLKARPEERRAFAWRLQRPIVELFPEAANE